jgi:hypothetical protein
VAKLQITALDGEHAGQVLEAQFNPKELSVDRAVPWQQQASKGPADLEFEQAEPARMSFELLFDGVEAATSVQPPIDKLTQFSSVETGLHRPPRVKVTWGSAAGGMPAFNGVIEAVSVRYVMFAPNGIPLRATVQVRLKQAAHVSVNVTPPRR